MINSTDARRLAELEFGLTGGSLWQPYRPQDQPAPPEGFGIDHRLGAAALRAPAASGEDSHPHAILKLQPRNSFDCRVQYEPQLRDLLTCTLRFYLNGRFPGVIWKLARKENI